jgi:hypothetical protein
MLLTAPPTLSLLSAFKHRVASVNKRAAQILSETRKKEPAHQQPNASEQECAQV